MNTEKSINEVESNTVLPIVRQRFLSICERMYFNAETLTEDTDFFDVCSDAFDFIELVLECEKEFDCQIDEKDKTEYSFDTVKQFIDWASSFVA